MVTKSKKKRVLVIAALCVGIGGFIGSVCRYILGFVPFEGDFPLMTFLINFLGAVFIGVVFEVAMIWPNISDNIILFLKTGVCGGFSTFSAFSLETMSLLEHEKYALGILYAGGSVLICLSGVILGRLFVHFLRFVLAEFIVM